MWRSRRLTLCLVIASLCAGLLAACGDGIPDAVDQPLAVGEPMQQASGPPPEQPAPRAVEDADPSQARAQPVETRPEPAAANNDGAVAVEPIEQGEPAAAPEPASQEAATDGEGVRVAPAPTEEQAAAEQQTTAEQPAPPARAIEWETEPLELSADRRQPNGSARAARLERIEQRIETEREWCRLEGGLVEPSGLDSVVDWADPATDEELIWMRVVARETAEHRGLEWQQEPPVFVISPGAYRRALCPMLLAHDESDVPAPSWYLDQLLGSVHPAWTPSTLEYSSAMMAAGWYYPLHHAGGGEIVLISERPLPTEYVSVLSHEYVHALQDQHFDLAGHSWDKIGSSDAATAFSWIYEGDASFNNLRWRPLTVNQELRDYEWGPLSFGYRPISLHELFPERAELTLAAYGSGSVLIAQIQRAQGRSAVDALLVERVDSTTQVLHPAALAADSQPLDRSLICAIRPAVVRDAPCDGLRNDRVGEAMLGTFIAEATGEREMAVRAAEGWQGDLLRVTEMPADDGDDVLVVVWQIVFENEAEHEQAVSALRDWAIAQSLGQARAAIGAPLVGWDAEPGSIRLVDHARMLWLIAVGDASVADAIAISVLEIEAAPDWWMPG